MGRMTPAEATAVNGVISQLAGTGNPLPRQLADALHTLASRAHNRLQSRFGSARLMLAATRTRDAVAARSSPRWWPGWCEDPVNGLLRRAQRLSKGWRVVRCGAALAVSVVVGEAPAEVPAAIPTGITGIRGTAIQLALAVLRGRAVLQRRPSDRGPRGVTVSFAVPRSGPTTAAVRGQVPQLIRVTGDRLGCREDDRVTGRFVRGASMSRAESRPTRAR
jgi:hypothetical protein